MINRLVLNLSLLLLIAAVTSSIYAQQPMLDPNLIAQTGKQVSKEYQITFPNDHYAHPEYDIEWWYLTANLQDESGDNYAVQFTLFRFRSGQPQNSWDDGQAYMAHASIHTDEKHWFTEKFAKGGVGNVGVSAQPFTVFIDDWKWQAEKLDIDDMFPSVLSFYADYTGESSPSSKSNTQVTKDIAKAKLQLQNKHNYVLHGEQGYSIKSGNAQHASYYYSQPFIDVDGTLTLEGKEFKVKGNAWFDHEWTSQLIDQQTVGWDWFSIHLDNGDKLMAFVMRLVGQEDYVTGTYINSDGSQRVLLPQQITLTPLLIKEVAGKDVPLRWSIDIPSENLSVSTQTTKDEQFNPARFSYYEGSIEVSGTHTGKGFMELTGY